MKKIILTSVSAVALLAAANYSQAQGVLSFASSGGGTAIVSNTVTTATAKITSGQFAWGLYVGSSAAEVQASTTPVLTFTNTSFAGVISSANFTINALTGGTTYFFEVKGWTAASGASTYENAIKSGFTGLAAGVSSIGQITPLAVGSPNPNIPGLFGAGAGQVSTPTMLTPVPEPTTMVLGGLGIAALAFFRRRK